MGFKVSGQFIVITKITMLRRQLYMTAKSKVFSAFPNVSRKQENQGKRFQKNVRVCIQLSLICVV